jgi:hypothetical protein
MKKNAYGIPLEAISTNLDAFIETHKHLIDNSSKLATNEFLREIYGSQYSDMIGAREEITKGITAEGHPITRCHHEFWVK